ncbi:hypothetical protein BT69DRAFT_1267680 [Atractiella rhizophila]|nr:hypothetical protein BT69DRAFT_1267680 [Atractiella rhizophila]
MSESEMHRITLSAQDFPIDEVTLYSKRAEVSRTVNCALKKGDNEVVVGNLPTCLIRETLKVDGSAEINTILKYVTYQVVDVERVSLNSSPEYKALVAQVNTLRASLERVHSRKEVLKNFVAALSPEKAGVEQLKEALKYQEEEGASMYEREVELGKELQRVQEAKNDLERGVNGGKADGTERLRGKATVGVWAEEEGEVELSFSYATDKALWTPRYDARLTSIEAKSGEKPLKLSYKAVILQATGEDWNNIQLSLSTAIPTLSTKPPTLNPWTLSALQPEPKAEFTLAATGGGRTRQTARKSTGGKAARKQLADGSGLGEVARYRKMTVQTLEVKTSNHLSTQFELPGVTTLKSLEDHEFDDLTGWFDEEYEDQEEMDGRLLEVLQRRTVAINELNLPASFEWFVVPRMSESVFLNASCKNTSEYPLLKGPATVYLDGSFVAKSVIVDVNVNEKFILNLGPDRSIRVSYPPRTKNSTTSGFISKARSHTYTQRAIIHNTKQQSVNQLTLLDRVPLSSDGSIHVKIIKPQLPDANTVLLSSATNKFVSVSNGVWARWKPLEGDEAMIQDGKPDGRIEWLVELDAGKKTTLVTEWEVSAAVGVTVLGLENEE